MRRITIVSFSVLFLIALTITLIPKLYHEELEKIALTKVNENVNGKVEFAHLHASAWTNFPNLTVTIQAASVVPNISLPDSLLKAERLGHRYLGSDYRWSY